MIRERGFGRFDPAGGETHGRDLHGGPVGIDAVAATLSEEVNTLEEMVEPYLLKIGFLMRTKRGRMVSKEAIRHLGLTGTTPGMLFT